MPFFVSNGLWFGRMDGRQDCESKCPTTTCDRVKWKRREDSSVHLLLRSQARKYFQAHQVLSILQLRREETMCVAEGNEEIWLPTTSSRDSLP